MPPRVDLTGQSFDRLTVLEPAPSRGAHSCWRVLCACGSTLVVRTNSLRTGNTRSCGCLVRDGNTRTHGEAQKTPEYLAWQLMKIRAKKSNGRIAVVERWATSYENFLQDMGRRPSPTHTVDRVDGSKGYAPDNCRWATKREQAQNVKSNHTVTFLGQTKCVTEWARVYELAPTTILLRLKLGWSVVRALTTRPLHATGTKAVTHGATRGGSSTREYRIWKQMRARCAAAPQHQDFATYGGRGIRVCARWNDFALFLADMGPCPPGHSLDRKDPNGNYEPSNCRWATAKAQQRNRRNNRLLTVGTETHCVQAWADMTGIGRTTIEARLRRGWSVQKAVGRG